MKKFDKNRPHGLVVGDVSGAAFHQDGVYFLNDGTPVGQSEPAPSGKVIGKPGKADDDQVDAQLGNAKSK